MAKSDSLLNLKGTHGGITFVRSLTYGDHVRAARGTHKKAKVNAAFEKQSKKLVQANLPARILKDALNPHRQDFYYGQLWQTLVSMTNEALGEDGTFDFAMLKPFDLYPAYRLSRLLELAAKTEVDLSQSILAITLSYEAPPNFGKLPMDGYRLKVIAIFPDLQSQTSTTEAVESNVIDLHASVGPLNIRIPIPEGATSFLICVRLDGCERGRLASGLSTKGMKVVAMGRV